MSSYVFPGCAAFMLLAIGLLNVDTIASHLAAFTIGILQTISYYAYEFDNLFLVAVVPSEMYGYFAAFIGLAISSSGLLVSGAMTVGLGRVSLYLFSGALVLFSALWIVVFSCVARKDLAATDDDKGISPGITPFDGDEDDMAASPTASPSPYSDEEESIVIHDGSETPDGPLSPEGASEDKNLEVKPSQRVARSRSRSMLYNDRRSKYGASKDEQRRSSLHTPMSGPIPTTAAHRRKKRDKYFLGRRTRRTSLEFMGWGSVGVGWATRVAPQLAMPQWGRRRAASSHAHDEVTPLTGGSSVSPFSPGSAPAGGWYGSLDTPRK